MLPTSSCGTLMSPTAIGHTGFTGTSLWIDWERDVYVVLLTNRVHPTREPNTLAPLRPPVHDAVMRAAAERQPDAEFPRPFDHAARRDAIDPNQREDEAESRRTPAAARS